MAALSKGFRQRLGLAQALVNQPPLLIMDEPTIGWTPQIVEIRQLIKDLKGAHTVMLSSHILPEVSQLCHRVIIINGPDRGQRHRGKPFPAAGSGVPGADDGDRTG